MKPTDLLTVDRFYGLMLGKNGSGKSGAIASMAMKYKGTGKKLLWIDLDRRFRGALGCRDFLPPEVWDLIDLRQDINIDNGFKALDSELEMMLIKQGNGQLQYGGLVIESWWTVIQTLLYDSKRLKGNTGKGNRKRGAVSFNAPDDYNYASAAIHSLVYDGFMKMRFDVILSGWTVDVYGKDSDGGDEDAYKPEKVIGQKMLATSKLSEEIPGYFDEVYRFEKREGPQGMEHIVHFYDLVAKSARPELVKKKMMDITRKSFWDEMQKIKPAP